MYTTSTPLQQRTGMPAQHGLCQSAAPTHGAGSSSNMPPGQPTHTSSRDATQTQNHSPTGGSAGICVASKLDQVLAQQDMAAAPLLLTAANVSPLHVPADDLLHFVAVQQWVHNILKVQLPLLNGAFVLVPSPALEQTAHSAAADAFPWRLRQVAGVKLGPVGSDPAAATVVLVGGDSVAAGDVCSSALDEVQDYQELCCELSDLQSRGQLRQLLVFDAAHIAWRLRVACELETAIQELQEEQARLLQGGFPESAVCEAHAQGVASVKDAMMQLPPPDWVANQVIPFIELSPTSAASTAGSQQQQLQQPLSQEAYSQLLQDAAGAWQQYTHLVLARQPVPAATGPACLQQQSGSAGTLVPLLLQRPQQQPSPPAADAVVTAGVADHAGPMDAAAAANNAAHMEAAGVAADEVPTPVAAVAANAAPVAAADFAAPLGPNTLAAPAVAADTVPAAAAAAARAAPAAAAASSGSHAAPWAVAAAAAAQQANAVATAAAAVPASAPASSKAANRVAAQSSKQPVARDGSQQNSGKQPQRSDSKDRLEHRVKSRSRSSPKQPSPSHTAKTCSPQPRLCQSSHESHRSRSRNRSRDRRTLCSPDGNSRGKRSSSDDRHSPPSGPPFAARREAVNASAGAGQAHKRRRSHSCSPRRNGSRERSHQRRPSRSRSGSPHRVRSRQHTASPAAPQKAKARSRSPSGTERKHTPSRSRSRSRSHGHHRVRRQHASPAPGQKARSCSPRRRGSGERKHRSKPSRSRSRSRSPHRVRHRRPSPAALQKAKARSRSGSRERKDKSRPSSRSSSPCRSTKKAKREDVPGSDRVQKVGKQSSDQGGAGTGSKHQSVTAADKHSSTKQEAAAGASTQGGKVVDSGSGQQPTGAKEHSQSRPGGGSGAGGGGAAAADKSKPASTAGAAAAAPNSKSSAEQARLAEAEAAVNIKVNSASQGWMQQLAELLRPAPGPGEPAAEIDFSTLEQMLPLPALLTAHFGSIQKFVEKTPELQWANSTRRGIILCPQAHRQLLQDAEAAAAVAATAEAAAPLPEVHPWLREVARLLPTSLPHDRRGHRWEMQLQLLREAGQQLPTSAGSNSSGPQASPAQLPLRPPGQPAPPRPPAQAPAWLPGQPVPPPAPPPGQPLPVRAAAPLPGQVPPPWQPAHPPGQPPSWPPAQPPAWPLGQLVPPPWAPAQPPAWPPGAAPAAAAAEPGHAPTAAVPSGAATTATVALNVAALQVGATAAAAAATAAAAPGAPSSTTAAPWAAPTAAAAAPGELTPGLRALIHQWLVGLAKLLGPPPPLGCPESRVLYFTVLQQHPLPEAVKHHYTTVCRFVRATPCLGSDTGRELFLHREAHCQLLLEASQCVPPPRPRPLPPAAAAAPPAAAMLGAAGEAAASLGTTTAAATGPGAAHTAATAAAPVATAAAGAPAAAPTAAVPPGAATSATSAVKLEAMQVAAAATAAAAARPPSAAAAAPVALPRGLQAQIIEWLLGLARLLGPPPPPGYPDCEVDFHRLLQEHPIPGAVVAYYKTPCQFVKATPGMRTNQAGRGLILFRAAHCRLLLEAHQQSPALPPLPPAASAAAAPPVAAGGWHAVAQPPQVAVVPPWRAPVLVPHLPQPAGLGVPPTVMPWALPAAPMPPPLWPGMQPSFGPPQPQPLWW